MRVGLQDPVDPTVYSLPEPRPQEGSAAQRCPQNARSDERQGAECSRRLQGPQRQEGMLSINQSPGEFESKDKNSGATGNPGRLPEGGGLELGFEGGRDGIPLVSCNPSA